MDLGRILDGTPKPSKEFQYREFLNRSAELSNVSGDYWLPVPMTEFQKELTSQVASLHYSDILKLFEEPGLFRLDSTSSASFESIKSLYMNSQLVATHPYLLVDHYMPNNLLLREVPDRLARSSGKFKVLQKVLELIQDLKCQVALIARPGKTIDLVEAFLLGKFVNYIRYSGSYLREPSTADNELSTIHIIPSGNFDISLIESKVRLDFVIAFDQSFDVEASRAIRSHMRVDGTLSPIIRFIPQYSVEHISLKISKDDPDEAAILKRVVAAIIVLRHKVGAIPSDLKLIYDQRLQLLKTWFERPDQPWPLPELGGISEYSPKEVSKALLNEVEEPVANEGEINEKPDYYQVKRLKRETDYVGINEPDGTNINNASLKELLTHSIIQKLEDVIRDSKLKTDELEEYRLVAADRQTAFERLKEEMADKVLEADSLQTKVRIAERNAERMSGEVQRATTNLEISTKDLEEARSMLKDGPPDLAKLEEQREKIVELENELKRANEKLESRAIENDYMRMEYQGVIGCCGGS